MMTMNYHFYFDFSNVDNCIPFMLYQILNVSCIYYILYILRKVVSLYQIHIISNTMYLICASYPYVNSSAKLYNHVFISKTLKVAKITAIKFVDAQNAAMAANPKPISPRRSSGWSHCLKINKQQCRYMVPFVSLWKKDKGGSGRKNSQHSEQT